MTIPSGYNLVWSDEFNNTLDTSEWEIWVGHHPNDLSCLTKDNVYTSNGSMIIRSQKQSMTCNNLFQSGTYNCQYTSGYPTTIRSWKYGYFECRAKLPKGKGIWPAFWMRTAKEGNHWYYGPEIDIFEFLGDNPTTLYFTYHYSPIGTVIDCNNPTYPSTQPQIQKIYWDVDYSLDYHVYASEWTSTYVTFLLDGVEMLRVTSSQAQIPPCPMRVYFDTFVGGSWPGAPNSSTVFPQYFYIDYLRVYQKGAPVCNSPTSTLSIT